MQTDKHAHNAHIWIEEVNLTSRRIPREQPFFHSYYLYLGAKDDEQNERCGQLAPGKLEHEEVIRMLSDPRDPAEDCVGR